MQDDVDHSERLRKLDEELRQLEADRDKEVSSLSIDSSKNERRATSDSEEEEDMMRSRTRDLKIDRNKHGVERASRPVGGWGESLVPSCPPSPSPSPSPSPFGIFLLNMPRVGPRYWINTPRMDAIDTILLRMNILTPTAMTEPQAGTSSSAKFLRVRMPTPPKLFPEQPRMHTRGHAPSYLSPEHSVNLQDQS